MEVLELQTFIRPYYSGMEIENPAALKNV